MSSGENTDRSPKRLQRPLLENDADTHADSLFVQLALRGLALPVTGHDLHLVHLHQVSHLPELHVIQDERPHVVAEAVGVQGALQETHTQHPVSQR